PEVAQVLRREFGLALEFVEVVLRLRQCVALRPARVLDRGEPLDLGLRLPDVPLEFAQPPPRLLRDLLERAADDADAVRHLGVLLEPARRLLLVLREGVLRQALRLARNLPRASPET